jgi:hypothetical protein
LCARNETSMCMKIEFLNSLNDDQLFKKGPASRFKPVKATRSLGNPRKPAENINLVLMKELRHTENTDGLFGSMATVSCSVSFRSFPDSTL